MKLDSDNDDKEGISESETKLASVVAMFKTFLEQYMSLELLRSKNSADLEHIHKNCLSTAETLKKVEDMFMFNKKPSTPPSPSNPFISSSGGLANTITQTSLQDAVKDLQAQQVVQARQVEDKCQQQTIERPLEMPEMPKMPPINTLPSWPNQQNVNDKIVVEMQNYKRKIGEYAVSIAIDLNKIQSQIWEQHVAVNDQLSETAKSMADLRLKLDDLFKL